MDETNNTENPEAPQGLAFRPDWLARVQEAPIDSTRRILDPHFHFFDQSEVFPHFRLDDLRADTADHQVEQAIFIQCREHVRLEGPEHLRPVGETEWVDQIANQARQTPGVQIGAIVGDAALGFGAIAGETLDAHREASSLFRGIRDMGIWDASPEIESIETATGPDFYGRPQFREGFAELARRDLSFDAYQYHPQLFSLEALARAFPDTLIICDHLGAPLAEGPYRGKREEVFEQWAGSMKSLAECPNVFVKLGGMAMPWSGFGWTERESPPTSDEFVAAYERYYRHAIESFGPDRCMFESNFPVDRLSLNYTVLWNAFKKIAAPYSEAEQDSLFFGTASRAYRIRRRD